jgi:hypothetical protein
MLVYKCDICREEITTDVLRRITSRGSYGHGSTHVWEVCERCEPRLFELLGDGREWRPDTAPASVKRRT